MYKNRYSMMVLVLILGSLLSISFFSFSARSESLEMLTSVGIHEVNLSEPGKLMLKGFIEIENKAGYTANITGHISNELLKEEFGSDMKPRTHKLGLGGEKANITFVALPDISWIKFEKTKYVIEPYGRVKVEYELCFSREELEQYGTENNTKGFMCYIYVKGEGGSQVNIEFRYKLFLLFTGQTKQNIAFSLWMLIPIIIILGGIIIFIYKHSRKKDPFRINEQKEPFRIKKPSVVVKKDDTNTDIHKQVDNILKSDNLWGKDG